MTRDLIRPQARTVTGRMIGELCADAKIEDEAVIRPISAPLCERAGFVVMRGNLFNSAIMKTSVISSEFRARYLSDPTDPDAFEGTAVVFDGPEDYHARIDDPALAITEECILFMRGVGPIGYPGAAEVVNMRPPDYLLRKGVRQLPCVGDGRQSGTSGSPSILNASPEAAAGGGLALLQTGDRVRIDLRKARLDVLVSAEEIDRRRSAFERAGGYRYPPSQTPWQEIQRALVGQLENGASLNGATEYQRIAQTRGLPRDNH
jgi:dihydroxy-acid dehydratase